MKIVDLTQSLTHQMPVYPGDPEVVIAEIHTLQKEGWRLRKLTLSSHLGTHVNVPYHMIKDGKKLDEYPLETFIGQTAIYQKKMKFYPNTGVLFTKTNIDLNISQDLISTPPKFIGLSANFEFDIKIEKLLLEYGIISFENLVNTEKLPSRFIFYGVPLNIPGSDGSPVRAFAVID